MAARNSGRLFHSAHSPCLPDQWRDIIAFSKTSAVEADISFIPYFGYTAGVLTVLSFMPQLARAWKTQRVRDLSTGMFVLLITSAALWLAYGVLIDDWPVILTNAGVVLLNCGILAAKIRFRHNA
ncbi:MAG: SemiSWEET transporter [Gemmatimonadota bacterium]